jgi:hypothetical protein
MRRKLPFLAAMLLIAGAIAGGALAFDSGNNPGTAGATTISWTGHGTTGGSLDTVQCDAKNDPNGANQPYLLWILTTDGGSIQNDSTTPVLHLGGTGSGDYTTTNPSNNSAAHFVTPFFTLSGLTADASINVLTTGDGSWNLNISHGCPGGGEAAAHSSVSTEIHKGATDSGSPDVISNDAHIGLGSTVHDSAAIETTPSDADIPAGSYVRFFFFDRSDCSGDPISHDDSVSGSDRSVDPSLAEGPLAAGDYSYQAEVISGDLGKMLDSALSGCEPFHVDKADTRSSTTIVRNDTSAQLAISPTPHVPLGTTVHDTATVGSKADSISMAGTLTYHFYTGTECSSANEVGTAEDVAVDADGNAAPSSNHGPLEAGSYSFNASYGGNDNYNASGLSACEPLIVDKGNTTSSTTIVRNDTSAQLAISPTPHVPLGTTVHDTATVGIKADSISMAGTLTYHFYTGTECSSANEVGTAEAVAVDADGNAAASSNHGPLGAGSYSFNASYGGNDNYNASGLSTCEPLIVDKGTLTIATKIHDANHNVVTSVLVGVSVHDTAQLSGAVTGFTPDASKISFTWFATNNQCTVGTGTSVANTGADESTGDPRSAAKGPLAYGSYSFNASFVGDSNYNPVGPSTCEPLSVFRAPVTPGYWKNHLADATSGVGHPYYDSYCPTTALKNAGGSCSTQGPWAKQYLPKSLGAFSVSNILTAAQVFSAMSCSFSGNSANQNQQAIGCLAGQLLAAKLNVANGANTCINTTITTADAFLTNPPLTAVTFPSGGYTANSINYIGPAGNYTTITYTGTTNNQRAVAIALKTKFDTYNNGGGC